MAILMAIAATPLFTRGEDPRPNIVFIMADDLGWRDVGFHEGTVPTPHLDRLASQSLELTQHYVAPVCTPTRVGLLTGRYWSRYGITTPKNERCLPFDTVTLPRALQQSGYATCLVGKWHLGSKPEWGPNRFGFEHAYGSLAGGVNPWGHYYKKGPYSETWHRHGKLLKESGHVTDLLTQEAIDWIQSRDERPFFLYVPFTAVHLPIDEPKQWLDRVPAHVTGDVARQYAACTMHLDDSVARILAALREKHFVDNTLVVFTSDNGGSTAENNDTRYPFRTYPQGRLPGDNRPLRGKKGDVYEGGIRVPTLLHWPGRLAAGQFEFPVHICDWMPTFCHLAEFQPQRDLRWDGTNVWTALSADPASRTGIDPERILYWAGPSFRSVAVRQGPWKLVALRRDDRMTYQLFHLGNDPEEKVDLSGSQSSRFRMLREALDAERARDSESP